MFVKEIIYDRESRDYAMYLDRELVGFARSYHAAEVMLDDLVYSLMYGEYFRAEEPQCEEPTGSISVSSFSSQ